MLGTLIHLQSMDTVIVLVFLQVFRVAGYIELNRLLLLYVRAILYGRSHGRIQRKRLEIFERIDAHDIEGGELPNPADPPIRTGKGTEDLPKERTKHTEKMRHGIFILRDVRMKSQMVVDVHPVHLQLGEHQGAVISGRTVVNLFRILSQNVAPESPATLCIIFILGEMY
jgi:hypothetical protein